MESEYFEHWSFPEHVLGADEQDPDGFQINSMPVDIYEGLYVALLETDVRPQRLGMQLAVSRDGLQWTRVADRFVFLGQQQDAAAWDQAAPTDWVRPATGLHTVTGQVRFHYNAGPLDDGCYGIGMARWRPDGFVSLTAGGEGGKLLTRSFLGNGPALHLNLDAGGGADAGEVRVKICDLQGHPLDATPQPNMYRDLAPSPPSDWSAPIRGDHLDTVVDWSGGSGLRGLRGRLITLRVQLRNAHLYSFWTG